MKRQDHMIDTPKKNRQQRKTIDDPNIGFSRQGFKNNYDNMLNRRKKMDNIEEMLENFTTELKFMKKNQMYILELNNATYEIKNLLEKI